MRFEIRHKTSGKTLFSKETGSLKLCVEEAVRLGADLEGANFVGADLRDADLRRARLMGANLREAYLRGAYLRGAYIVCADLRSADLRDADLRGADLRSADLRGADLGGANLVGASIRGAHGINKYLCTPLTMLLDQPGKIRAYKLVMSDGTGSFRGGITYEVGGEYSVDNADCTDEQCAAGISLATLSWCIREWRKGYRILVAEFEAADIASIPIATDGKFRVRRCRIVAEKGLKEIGLNEQ